MATPDKTCPSGDGKFSLRSRNRVRELWQRTTVLLMVAAAFPLRICSPSLSGRIGIGLGKLAYRIARRHRRRACANLHLAYGEAMSRQERENLTCRVFQHFGRCVVEFVRGPALTEAEFSRMVTCEGWEHIESARAGGKGVLMFTGHIGNWEILGRWLAGVRRLPLTVVAKDPKSPALARYLRAMREGAGFAVLSKGESARSLLRVLRRGEAVCLLADQNSADLFTPFFGIPTGTVAGPATLALHAGVALVPIFCVRKPDGSFLVRCLPALPVSAGSESGDRVLQLTAAMNLSLERMIREYPDQWLWLHNRWKSAFEERNTDRAWSTDAKDALANGGFEEARRRWQGR
ncbi:MAG: lysophospholipid acyltransferase family protein [Capsulimonadales bacterium]|nr:lysophospholipid acyltransferase family protein [Capsulimonadales bacterium]